MRGQAYSSEVKDGLVHCVPHDTLVPVARWLRSNGTREYVRLECGDYATVASLAFERTDLLAKRDGHVHRWLIDQQNHGRCQGCGLERLFPWEPKMDVKFTKIGQRWWQE